MIAVVLLTLASCGRQQPSATDVDNVLPEIKENREAKAMLQGIWLESESEEAVFRVEGDTIYYPDPADQPAYFRIVDDSLELNNQRYPIVKQTEHLFWFNNQGGDIRKLVKSDIPDDTIAFSHRQMEILNVTEVMKTDSVVMYGGERYHWYIAVNPTKYRVLKTKYSSEGVAVQNVYYDNIIHISLYQGKKCLFSRDFKKDMYNQNVPTGFLDQAILGNMQYEKTDAKGMHFNATLCIPDEASCYMVETLIGFDGEMSMKLLEY